MPFRTLLALQAEVLPGAYRSEEAFRERVFALLKPLEGTPSPRLAAFPELFGLPLLLHLEGEVSWRDLLRDPLLPWRRARRAYGVFHRVMAEAARAFGPTSFRAPSSPRLMRRSSPGGGSAARPFSRTWPSFF